MCISKDINKSKPLMISLGVILSLNNAPLVAAPSMEQIVSPAQSRQSNLVKTSKAKKIKKPTVSTPVPQGGKVEQPEQSSAQKAPNQQPKKNAQSKHKETAETSEELAEIKVTSGRGKNLIGLTGSASQGEVSQAQFEYRPMARNGELVELVPGALATQHSGSGKANQYFLRGYNLDHGTDFTTIVDGIPMNMPSHAHGQGYMDINSVIPELVKKIEYGKGPYYGEVGDFSAAGYTKMMSMDKLDQGIFKFTGGSFDYYRTLVANSSKVGDGDLLYAGEFNAYGGPWQQPEDSRKFNGMLRYTLNNDDWGVALNAKAYTNHWTATNQIPQAGINNNAFVGGIYGTMNPTDGGNSNRYSFSSNLWNKGKDWKNDANVYVVYYDVSLFSDFTGYLNGPLGDQIHQFEHRVQTGGNIEHTRYNNLFGFEMDNTVGMNFRHDEIMGLGLNNTYNQQYLSTVNLDNVSESTAGAFFKNQTHWLEKFRTIAALRGDFINNDVTALANGYTNQSALCIANPTQVGCNAANAATSAAINAANSGSAAKIIISPKLSMIVGPWYDTEYFANIGYGYHSNDARGTTEQLNPADGAALGSNALISPLAWARGGEVGARTNYIPGLNSTLAFWWLESSQELVWQGDQGNTSVNGKSYRYGVELTNYYKPTDWLTLDADMALTTARFAALPGAGNCTNPANPTQSMACTDTNIPNSVGRVVSTGATVVAPNGMFGTIRVRHFGDVAQDSQGNWAPDTTIVNLGTGYKQKTYKLELDVFNVFDSQSSDIAYAYTTQYSQNIATLNYGTVRHPVEPRQVRASVTINF